MTRGPREYMAPGRGAAEEPALVPRTATPGKRTLSEALPTQRIALPRAAARGTAEVEVHGSAQRGVASPSSPLPFAGLLQRAFGRHDLSGVQAHTGSEAAASAREMGARAYATGDHVVLGEGADLHTVAHEAAHVVQQRGGVQLKGGVGQVGDAYEQHADAVADQVVRGESAEALLDLHAGPATPRARVGTGAAVQQMKIAHPELPHDVETTDFEAFQTLVNLFLKQSPDRIYALHMALLEGVGHDPKVRVAHQRHFELLGRAMERVEHPAAPAVKAPSQRVVAKPAPTDGLVMANMGRYLARVREIEQQMLPMREARDVVTALYNAAKLLLPQLAAVFPALVIDDSGDDASFSRAQWNMTIPTTDELEDQEATDLRHLSSTVLHETRHLEQAWLEATKAMKPRSGHRQTARSNIPRMLDINEDAFEQLIKIPFPGVETEQLGAAVAKGRAEQGKHNGRMRRLEQLRERDGIDPSMASALNVAPLTKAEQEEMAELLAGYHAFPREADAFNIEAIYEDVYDGAAPLPSAQEGKGQDRKGARPAQQGGPWREQRVVAANAGEFVIDPDETPSNGDCFFASVIRLGLHGGRDVAGLRQLARTSGARVEILQAGEWANLDDIAALANGLGVRFVVVAYDLAYKKMQESVRGNAGDLAHVAQVFGGHFVPMRKRGG